MSVKSEATGKAREQDTMTQATRTRGSRLFAVLCLLALCLFASATFSGRLITTQSPVDTTDPGLVLRATDGGAQASATDDRPTDRSQDRHSRGEQQPATVGESEDSPDKKTTSGAAVLFAPFELPAGDTGSEPEPVASEAASEGSPPQLLQRPPPAG